MSDPAGDTSGAPVVTNLAVAAAKNALGCTCGTDAVGLRFHVEGCATAWPVGPIRDMLEAAAPEIIAAHRYRLVSDTADEVFAVTAQTVIEAEAASTARIAELEAALAGVLGRFTQSDAGWRARISGTDLDRLKATADGRPADGQ